MSRMFSSIEYAGLCPRCGGEMYTDGGKTACYDCGHVKTKRNPITPQDEVRWILGAVNGQMDKVEDLDWTGLSKNGQRLIRRIYANLRNASADLGDLVNELKD